MAHKRVIGSEELPAKKEKKMTKFEKNQPIHCTAEEVGIINGHYVGPFFVGNLHEFKDLSGKSCAVDLTDLSEGFHPQGKREWR